MAAYDIGPKIGIEGEKEFRNSIKAIDSQIRALGSELKTLSKEYDENDRSIDGVVKKQKTLNSAIDATENKIKLLTSQYEKQSAELRKLEDALEKARRENGEGSDEALKAEAALAKQATTVNRLENQLQTARGQLADFGNQLENLGNRATIAGDKLQSAGDKIAGIGSKISSAGNVLTGTVTAPLLAAGAAAISMASDYEESLNKVDVAFGESSDRIREFAKTTVDTYGIAEGTALDMAALFGDMATSMQVPRDEAADMSEVLVGLAGDLASFKNISLEQVGTALKSIFTGETESLKELGVVMTEANLDAFALAEGFGKTTDEMTEAEKVQLRYQYVLNATRNAQGDYARTADGTANSLRTMQESAKELGVAFGQELLPTITPVIQGATKMIKSFGDLDDETKQTAISIAGIAAAAGPALKIVGTATTGIGKLTKGIGGAVSDIGKLVQSGGKATDSMGALGKVLGTLGPKGMIIGGVVAGLAAVGTALWKLHQDAIQAEIDEAFGNIKLTAEEIEDVANRLTTTEWTIKMDAAIDAKDELEAFESEVKSSLEELNKLNWKVGIGLELTDSEKESYISQVESFTKSASDYITQQGYSISLAVDLALGDSETGSNLSTFSNAYMAEAQGEMERLGQYLAQKVNDAFENNTLSRDRVNIQKIIDQMNGIVQEIQNYEYRARMGNLEIELETSGLGIDQESFQKINEAAQEALQEEIEAGEEMRIEATKAAVIEYDMLVDAGVSEQTAKQIYEDSKSQIERSLQENMGETINVPLKFGFDTLTQNFDTQINGALAEMQPLATEFINTLVDAFESGNTDISAVYGQFMQNVPELTGGAREAVEQYLEAIQPSVEQMEGVRDQCIAAGETVPESITEGLTNVAMLEAMVGQDGVGGMMTLLGSAITSSPEALQALQNSEMFGATVPQELASAIAMYSGYVYDANTGIWEQLSSDSAVAAQQIADELNAHGQNMDEELAQGLADQYGVVYENGKWVVSKAAQGVKDQTPEFVGASEDMAKAGVSAADLITSGAILGAPSVAQPDMVTPVSNARWNAQNWLWNNPLTVTVQGAFAGLAAGIAAIRGYETGGIVETPQLATVAENGAEAIIPLENNRARALDLWHEAGERLNAFAADQGRSTGETVRERIIQQSTDNSRTITVEEGAITIHTQAVDGKKIYREITQEMQREVKRKEVAYGSI